MSVGITISYLIILNVSIQLMYSNAWEVCFIQYQIQK